MQTRDLDGLKRDAIDKIIFHATPRQRLESGGPTVFERGEGALIYDIEGREYLDALSGGVFAVLVGYGREEIARAMYEQARRLNYTSPCATTSVVTIELARKLAELTPGDLTASFFCNSGSEAIEASIKLARQYHEANGQGRRYKVISLRRAYHGSTVGALSATGWSPHFGGFRRASDPYVPANGFANAMPPYCYRCELGLAFPSCNLACGTTIEQAILGSDPELVSCVLVEPVMGTAGCIVPPAGYLSKVRQICDPVRRPVYLGRSGVRIRPDGTVVQCEPLQRSSRHHGGCERIDERVCTDGCCDRAARNRGEAPRLLERAYLRRTPDLRSGSAR
jgi:adenosylmethionine-8-amino-7-oxononanoate aminotransferase